MLYFDNDIEKKEFFHLLIKPQELYVDSEDVYHFMKLNTLNAPTIRINLHGWQISQISTKIVELFEKQ